MDAFEIAMVIFMVVLVLFSLYVRRNSEDNPRFKQPESDKAKKKESS